jgi:hypothetical protein
MSNKPFIIEIEEAKDELTQCVSHIINDKKIPCYFIVSTLENILQQVRAGAANDVKVAMAQMTNKVETKTEG